MEVQGVLIVYQAGRRLEIEGNPDETSLGLMFSSIHPSVDTPWIEMKGRSASRDPEVLVR